MGRGLWEPSLGHVYQSLAFRWCIQYELSLYCVRVLCWALITVGNNQGRQKQVRSADGRVRSWQVSLTGAALDVHVLHWARGVEWVAWEGSAQVILRTNSCVRVSPQTEVGEKVLAVGTAHGKDLGRRGRVGGAVLPNGGLSKIGDS